MTSRSDLFSHAGAIEIETGGFMRAAGFLKLIDQGILPNTTAADGDTELFVPIVMSLDGDNAPAELPYHTAATGTGVVAGFADRAVFAWMTGFVRLRIHSYTLPYDAITNLSLIKYRGLRGIDIAERHTWTVMFGEKLRPAVVDDYREALYVALREKAGLGGPDADATRQAI